MNFFTSLDDVIHTLMSRILSKSTTLNIMRCPTRPGIHVHSIRVVFVSWLFLGLGYCFCHPAEHT